MSWIRYEDTQPEHPKVVALGVLEPLAGWLNHRVIAWCCRHHTDGKFSPEVVEHQAAPLQLAAYRINGKAISASKLADKLVAVGLWEVAEGGFIVHDFLHYQKSRQQAEQERAAAAQRQETWRQRQRNGVTPPSPGGVRNASVTPTPSRPVPSPSVSEPSVVSLPPRGGHHIPADHPLEKATEAIYVMRACRHPPTCHGDFVDQKRASGESQSDWHAAERRWAQRHDERALCHRRPVKASAGRDLAAENRARRERAERERRGGAAS